MTYEKLTDAEIAKESCRRYPENPGCQSIFQGAARWARDCLSAAPAGEPVAVVDRFRANGEPVLEWADGAVTKIGQGLYTAPVAAPAEQHEFTPHTLAQAMGCKALPVMQALKDAGMEATLNQPLTPDHIVAALPAISAIAHGTGSFAAPAEQAGEREARVPIPNARPLSEYIAECETIPERAAALREARAAIRAAEVELALAAYDASRQSAPPAADGEVHIAGCTFGPAPDVAVQFSAPPAASSESGAGERLTDEQIERIAGEHGRFWPGDGGGGYVFWLRGGSGRGFTGLHAFARSIIATALSARDVASERAAPDAQAGTVEGLANEAKRAVDRMEWSTADPIGGGYWLGKQAAHAAIDRLAAEANRLSEGWREANVAALASRAAAPVPADPLELPLVEDVKVGAVTIGKGCKARTLVTRMSIMQKVIDKLAGDKLLPPPAAPHPQAAPDTKNNDPE